jgi:hypothetical protein
VSAAVLGRIVGVGVTDIVGIRNSETWQWVDPGAFGLIGKDSFGYNGYVYVYTYI